MPQTLSPLASQQAFLKDTVSALRVAKLELVQQLTCVDLKVLQGHRAGHVANVGQHVLRDARGRACHALGLPIHIEEA